MDSEKIYARYFNLSLRFLSYRPRSEKEVYDYLKKKSANAKGLDEKIIAKIMQRLVELRFIDDLEFTKAWISGRNKSIRILKIELGQKGISKEIIEKALSQIDVSQKEESLLQRLIEKKEKSLKSVSDKRKAYEKMVSFLLRKGFDYEEIKKSLKDVEF